MPENQTAWNSDNKGVKETFTQTGRRGGDGRQAAQRRGHGARQQTAACEAGLAEQKTKDSKLAIKYWGEGGDRGRNSQSHRRVHWKVELEQSK